SVSRYFGTKPTQSFSPVPAKTSATSSSVVLRCRPRNSVIFRQPVTSLFRFQPMIRISHENKAKSSGLQTIARVTLHQLMDQIELVLGAAIVAPLSQTLSNAAFST